MTINVTRSFLPPREVFDRMLDGIWERRHLTNHGPLVAELERLLRESMGVRHCVMVANGTLALQLAIRALNVRGRVVTTPFSYVATTAALVWEGCEPVFADIERDSLCLDADAVDAVASMGAEAVLATHVYGNACDHGALRAVADRHGLKLIYDAAHAFGAALDGRALPALGDASVLSFHATKLFHTIEGGAILTDDDGTAARLRSLRNFGHDGPEAFDGLGVNAKANEVQAAMGLAVLPHVPALIASRRFISDRYDECLAGVPLQRPAWRPGLVRNHAYYPVLFRSEAELLRVRDALHSHDIVPRRYFYPPLNRLPYVKPVPMPVAESSSARVLCLPMAHDLPLADVERVAMVVRTALERR
jgi:dTDP-4-amino-4,6-dideoxygalactose transaminase